jgi:hypothetical protein
MITFENLAAVADTAKLLQLRFIRLGSCDKRREALELLCGAPEVFPVGLLCSQGVVLRSKGSKCFNGYLVVTRG